MSTDFGNNPINSDESQARAKIEDAAQLRVLTKPVIDGRDMEAVAVSVRFHGKRPQGEKLKGEDLTWL